MPGVPRGGRPSQGRKAVYGLLYCIPGWSVPEDTDQYVALCAPQGRIPASPRLFLCSPSYVGLTTQHPKPRQCTADEQNVKQAQPEEMGREGRPKKSSAQMEILMMYSWPALCVYPSLGALLLQRMARQSKVAVCYASECRFCPCWPLSSVDEILRIAKHLISIVLYDSSSTGEYVH